MSFNRSQALYRWAIEPYDRRCANSATIGAAGGWKALAAIRRVPVPKKNPLFGQMHPVW